MIAWNNDFIEAIGRYIRFVFPQGPNIHLVENYLVPERFSFGNVLDTYETIADFMEAKASSYSLRNSMAILDLPLPDLILLKIRPNPVSITEQKKSPAITLASMLIFAFPEVRWIFFRASMPASPKDMGQQFVYHWVSCDTLKIELMRRSSLFPLFDPAGLRNYIRKCLREDPETKKMTEVLPIRDELSASIEDEQSYAFLHSFVAYKLYCRSHLVMTEAAMDTVFKRLPGVDSGQQQKVEVTFEDMFLNFPDRHAGEWHLSELHTRDEAYQGLKEVKHRIFVTVGHKHIGWYKQNQEHIKKLKSSGTIVHIIYKPTGGVYSILKNGNLLRKYWQRRKQELRNAKPSSQRESGGGHSAPGRLLIVAERLISRTEKILSEAQTVQDCIHGATLALEAQELLGYRTPTTSLEAIALRHQLEIKAECMFYGVGYSKDMKNRLREIENEVNTVAHWFHPSIHKRSALNAQMSIVTEIMRILREFGQFDEEQECLNHLRKLHRQSSLLNHPWRKVFYPLRWYVETLIGSFSLFIVAILTWPVIFALLNQILQVNFSENIKVFSDYVTHAFIVFFGLQPNDFPLDPTAQILTVLMILMGFLHLGIFISHLYTLISRR